MQTTGRVTRNIHNLFFKVPTNEEALFPEMFFGCANEQEARNVLTISYLLFAFT